MIESTPLESLEQEVRSQSARIEALEHRLADHAQRFDSLQTRWWKRLWYRLDGWPGRLDLNSERRRWRPWH